MDRTNEESLDLFADLLEPCAEVIGDPEVAKVFKDGDKPIKAVKIAIKNHKAAVVEILALLDGVPVEDYKVNLLSLPVKLLNFLNSKEAKDLFIGQGLKTAAASSGSAMEATEDGAN